MEEIAWEEIPIAAMPNFLVVLRDSGPPRSVRCREFALQPLVRIKGELSGGYFWFKTDEILFLIDITRKI